MKTFIVATDYSSSACNALVYAALLAGQTGSKLVLFNSFFLPIPTEEDRMSLPQLEKRIAENKTRLLKIAAQIASTYEVAVDAKVGMGALVDELEELTSQYEEPLVILGMRGNSLNRKIFGSVAVSVIQQAKYPVLVVPAEARFPTINKILFACDYNDLITHTQLKPIKELVLLFNAQLQILHIEKTAAFAGGDPVPEIESEPVQEHIFRGVKHTSKELENEDIIKGIEIEIVAFNADLLVMIPHKKGFWDTILSHSNARKMALRTHIPLLALPDPHR